jgi:ribosome recycling factor
MVEDVISQLKEDVASTQKALKHDLSSLRTGRASISMLDGVRVNYYGTMTPLNQCANLSAPEPRLMVVKPWDKSLLQEIERAIHLSGLGITPQNDGEIIRLPIPQLTEERRRDLVKQAKARGEEAKIAMRNHRREANELLKEFEKDKAISEDDLKRALEKVQELVDTGVTEVDAVLVQKEKEILEV